MRFGTLDGRLVLVSEGRALDVATASGGALPCEVRAALARWDEVRAWAPAAGWAGAVAVDDAELGPPVPDPRQVFAVALNYRPHAAEAGFAAPDAPLVFTKFPSCITGPVTTVALPPGNVDWEIEVVAVIGAGGYRIPRSEAWDAVAGLTCGQDLSERLTQAQGRPAQFSLGKSFPGFGPIGPVAVTPDDFADRDDLGFESFLLTGAAREALQSGRTREMIFSVDDLVARLSAICPLLPGDLIFTGTPGGVGNRRTPPRFLRPGETLISRLEGVGELRQTFVA
ncbi:fumarylacetoacetate hydrolase family protein [Actinoplanes sp. NPDC026623]|uniref:fumarylacetoacetate hydrolase family protein n=1 Tax=Actinoplanes sp. NPDC026623 TaxID=3155610 RepID=UPI0033FAE981